MPVHEAFSIVRHRWTRCFLLHSLLSSFLWFLSSLCFCFVPALPFPHRCFRFLLFLSSQIVFLLALAVVTHPEYQDVASLPDLAFGALRLAWRAAVGSPLDAQAAQQASILARKLQTTRDRVLFLFLCAISGALSNLSLTWSLQPHFNILEEACRGAALGLVYATVHLLKRRMVLIFPIIQRHLFFRFKLGLPGAVVTGLKLAIASLPFAEAAVFILNSSTLAATGMKRRSLFVRETDFFQCSFFTVVCWEIGHLLVQVLHTKRHRFAPPLGSSAAETNPNDLLLTALEETENSSLIHYLAVLDLCMLSENNADTWQKTALFEETGDTYQRVISACLMPLDMLSLRLVKGLDGSSMSPKKDLLKQQMQSPGEALQVSWRENLSEIFRDFQLCSWCARIVASLTAISKSNDRYGVAQLRGCNGAVVSSLLSCLLVIEVYLGRRSSAQSGQLVGANSIKWTVPSRGFVVDTGKRQSFPFQKKSKLHKKAYAMADVLRTSLYQVITVFRSEMILGGTGPTGFLIAERDWLGKGKPLYGTHEMHVQKLSLLLDFKA